MWSTDFIMKHRGSGTNGANPRVGGTLGSEGGEARTRAGDVAYRADFPRLPISKGRIFGFGSARRKDGPRRSSRQLGTADRIRRPCQRSP